jgi:type I restriction-modification system, R subunit
MSKAKFWQMIGRGTRLCPGLLDGEDKQKFYIFDFCGNFEFFRMNKGKATANMIALQGAIFNLKFEISYKLQDIDYQIDRLIAYRKALVKQMSEKVQELPRDNFAVRQHLKYVDLYATEANYQVLTYEDSTSLDSRQIYFVNQIVEYIVHNGMMKDLSVLQESPFTDQGSVVEIFTDLTVWMGIRKVIESINANAAV